MWTGTFGRVEGEHVRSWILVGDTVTGSMRRLEVLCFGLLGTFLKNHYHAVALFHSRCHTLADTFLIFFLHHQFIDDSFYIVVLVAVGFIWERFRGCCRRVARRDTPFGACFRRVRGNDPCAGVRGERAGRWPLPL